jgi:endonuclease/exonuclease/phosphatase (EEP) superfamily protein YafD
VSLLAASLTLMTYNVDFANHDHAASLDAIEQADADVVLLQEITAAWRRAVEQRLAARYPHREFHLASRPAGGLAVLSKVPIQREQILPTPLPGWFPASRIVLATAAGPLQILHVHLRPAWDGDWFRGFMTTPPMRRKEIESYWKSIESLPTIVAGDFNEDPTGLAVAFLEGKGLVRAPTTGPTTWRYEHSGTELLKMNIDHVMADPSLTCRDARVIDAGRSDHRPVIVTIEQRP